MVTSSPHLSVAMTCRGSDCSASAVMGTLRTPGQLIFQLGAIGAVVAAGCVSVCARDAGTNDEAMMLSKAKFTVIDLCTEAPLRVQMEKLYFALTGIVGPARLLVHRTRVQVLVLCWTAVRALVHRGEYRAHDAGPN